MRLMDKALLEQAQKGLRLADITLRSSLSQLREGFEPKYHPVPEEAQFMQSVRRFEILEVGADEGKRRIFRVWIEFGIRWMNQAAEDLSQTEMLDAGMESQKVEELARIQATYVVEYEVQRELPRKALNEFARYNAPWHVWPFWREFVMNQCARLELPRAALPMQCLPNGQAEDLEG